MDDKIVSVSALLKAGQIDFIKLLINESIIDKEIFMAALCKCCEYKGIRSTKMISRILNTIDELWGLAGVDRIIFDHLISDIVNNFNNSDHEIFVDYFGRLTNLGGIVTDDYYNMLLIPRKSFFDYIEKNDFEINEDHIIAVVSGKISDHNICEWILVKWDACILQTACLVARNAHEKKTYFAKIMEKINIYHDINLVVFYLIICSRNSDIHDIMKYATRDYNELILLHMIAIYRTKIKDISSKFALFLQTHATAKKICDEVESELYNDYIIPHINFYYDFVISKLTLLVNAYYFN